MNWLWALSRRQRTKDWASFSIWETGPHWRRLACVFIFSSEAGEVQNSLTKGSLRRVPLPSVAWWKRCTSCLCEVKPAGLYSFYRETDNGQRGRTKEWPDKCIKWTDPKPHWALTVKFSFSRTALATLFTDVWIRFSAAGNFSVIYPTGRTKHSTGLPLKYSWGMMFHQHSHLKRSWKEL